MLIKPNHIHSKSFSIKGDEDYEVIFYTTATYEVRVFLSTEYEDFDELLHSCATEDDALGQLSVYGKKDAYKLKYLISKAE
jgi:hypothetical protein